MAFDVAYIFRAQDAYSSIVLRMAQAQKRMNTNLKIARRDMKRAAAAAKEYTKALRKTGKAMTDVGGKMFKSLTLPLALTGVYAVRQAGILQKMRVTYEQTAEGIDKAASKAMGREAFSGLLKLVSRTTYSLEELEGAAGIIWGKFAGQPELFVTRMKTITNLTAGFGADITRFNQAYLKVLGEGFLSGEMKNMFEENRVGVIKLIAEYYASIGEESKNEGMGQNRDGQRQKEWQNSH